MTAALIRNGNRKSDFATLLESTSEPIGFEAGDANVRRYVGNSSVAFQDPTGLAVPIEGNNPNAAVWHPQTGHVTGPNSNNYPWTPPATPPVPAGTPENHYHGLGSWELYSQDSFDDFIFQLLDPTNNGIDDWRPTRRGCVGLALTRLGWKVISPLAIPGADFFLSESAARSFLEEKQKETGKRYALLAIQAPIVGETAQDLQNRYGDNEIPVTKIPFDTRPLEGRIGGLFNVATWIKYGDFGYWEYMNHDCNPFDPKKPPAIRHKVSLPDYDGNYVTVYGVVPFKE